MCRRCRGRRRRAKGTPRPTRISIASRQWAGHSVRRVFSFFHSGSRRSQTNGKARLTLGVKHRGGHRLGPVTASFDKAGFALTADFVKPDANLSLFDLDFGFQPPTAIGLDIDAKVVHGGGFLDLDREHAQYAGALHLEIEGFASLSALGLLNTNIPGGGFSLLVIITADGFKPIPIGFGFMLAGIGGLLGIHRTVNEDAVQAACGPTR